MDRSLETVLDQVQTRGGYAVRQEAAGALERVLGVLGAHLVGTDRTDLARLLPPECAPLLIGVPPAREPLTPEGFVAAVDDCDQGGTLYARRAVTAVLSTIAEAADDALLRRILTQLPPGHAGLFGRTEPS
ncbi:MULTISPECIES: DUF2267 domain-containing protein [Streptomyces]|jgi:uncharacterized protein (DUF2267 family)|uniref:DUF2267 domain-containing protein n=1 Tax=Streptomyces TaxID=1883 RepID=UPI0007CD7C6D|nr:hypothetical protein A4V12_04465 [Streptomyces noursei]